MVSISEAFTSAFRAYQTGNLFEAEWTCQQIVDQQPDYVPALHLLGAVAQRTGRLESAIARYQQVISIAPDHFEAYGNLGVVLQDRGDEQKALFYFEQALRLKPDHAPTYYNLGNLLLRQKDLEGAIAHYQQALVLNPNHAKAHNNLGNAFREQKRLDEAIVHYQQAIELEPNNPQTYSNLGNVLQEQGKVEAAIAQYQQSLILQPEQAEVYFNLGNAMTAVGQFEAAATYYQSTLNLGLNTAEVHNNLGLVLQEQKQLAEAVDHFQQAIALKPDDPEFLNNLGCALYEQHDLAGAIVHQQQAIALKPDFAEAHLNLSFALLADGNFEQGFTEYEWRLRVPEFQLPDLPGDRWNGSDLQDKTLLLYAEQGFGDAMQLIRYIPLLAQQAAGLFVVSPPELIRLFSQISGITRLMTQDEPLPNADFHLPLMSLPLILQTTLETIPNHFPYLRALSASSPPASPSPATLLPPDTRYPTPDTLNIGITWATTPLNTPRQLKAYRNKTASLPLLMALQSISGVTLHSLQVGPHATDIAQYGFESFVVDRSPELHDFADTAAVIAELDLVITVDTAVAHLAGAMGKPVWVLLPFACDWRWMLHRQDSPWYPTMRLFRQESPGDWAGVMAAVVEALRQFQAQPERGIYASITIEGSDRASEFGKSEAKSVESSP